MIPVYDAKAEYERDRDQLEDAALRVLRSGRYILGPEVEAFETEVAEYLGVSNAVSCATGTDALWLAFRAMGLGPGDAVIVPAFTFFATASAVLASGAIPVFCDIDPETHTIDAGAVGDILDGRSAPHRRLDVDPQRIRAVVPVHLFGRVADMGTLLELAQGRGLKVIEDAAQAFGARDKNDPAGTIGDMGCFSFFPTKNLGGFGDGGLVATSDDDLDDRLRLLRAHGSRPKYTHHVAGSNSRLDAIQAALLRVRLAHIDEDIRLRGAIADAYDEVLAGVLRTPKRPTSGTHSFNLYVVEIDEGRDDVVDALNEAGIASAVHYPTPAHLQPAAGELGYLPGDFPWAEAACDRVLTLPMYPSLALEDVQQVAQTVAQALDRAS